MVSHPRQVARSTVAPHLKTRQAFINSGGKPEFLLKALSNSQYIYRRMFKYSFQRNAFHSNFVTSYSRSVVAFGLIFYPLNPLDFQVGYTTSIHACVYTHLCKFVFFIHRTFP